MFTITKFTSHTYQWGTCASLHMLILVWFNRFCWITAVVHPVSPVLCMCHTIWEASDVFLLCDSNITVVLCLIQLRVVKVYPSAPWRLCICTVVLSRVESWAAVHLLRRYVSYSRYYSPLAHYCMLWFQYVADRRHCISTTIPVHTHISFLIECSLSASHVFWSN